MDAHCFHESRDLDSVDRGWRKILTALVLGALLVAVVGSAVASEDTRDHGEEGDGRETHYELVVFFEATDKVARV
jgi:hypothetical protein